MSRLYEIGTGIRALIDRADADGVLDEEVVAALDKLEGELDHKAESVALAILELEAEAEAVEKEAKRLDERAKSLERRAAKLREYLAYWLDGRELKGRLVTIGYRKSESVEIIDETAIPEEYLRMVRLTDKTSIKHALKGGAVLGWAQLVVHRHMQIR